MPSSSQIVLREVAGAVGDDANGHEVLLGSRVGFA